MRVRAIVGKTVVKVNQKRTVTPYGVVYDIRSIEFDDGTLFIPHAVPTEDEYVVEGLVGKKKVVKEVKS